jgi:hypothetical protein
MGENELRSGAEGFERDELTQAEAARIAAEIDGDARDEDAAALADEILGRG